MKQAFILQGWYQKIDSNWYPWLKRELEKRGFTVFLPNLPTMHTDLPDMVKQLSFIEKLMSIDKNTVIFGHSLGALLGMRLAEKYMLDKLFLIAGWDYDDLQKPHESFWPSKINHKFIKKNVKKIIVISSDNDPYYTTNAGKEMAGRLGAKFILIKGAGHLTDKDGMIRITELHSLI